MMKLHFYEKFDFKSDFLFKDISPMEGILIESQMEVITFIKGQYLFYEGGVPTGVFYVDSGKVKLSKTGLDGQEQIFYIYKSGDLLGYHAALGRDRYEDSAVTMEDCTIRFIPIAQFEHLRKNVSQLNLALLNNMGHEFGALANIIGVMAQKSQTIRLAVFLLLLEKKYTLPNGDPAGISISREDLASLIGTSRESLGRSLKGMKDEGLIQINNKLILLKDKVKLLAMAHIKA